MDTEADLYSENQKSFHIKESNIHTIFYLNPNFTIEKIQSRSIPILYPDNYSRIIERHEFFMGFEKQVAENEIIFWNHTPTSLIITYKFNQVFIIPFKTLVPKKVHEVHEIITSLVTSKLKDSVFIGTLVGEIVRIDFSISNYLKPDILKQDLIPNRINSSEGRINRLKLHDNDFFLIAITAYNLVFYIEVESKEQHILSEHEKIICIKSFESQLILLNDRGTLKVYKSNKPEIHYLFKIKLVNFSKLARYSIFKFDQKVYILAESNKNLALFDFDFISYEHREDMENNLKKKSRETIGNDLKNNYEHREDMENNFKKKSRETIGNDLKNKDRGTMKNYLKANDEIRLKKHLVKKIMRSDLKIFILDEVGKLNLIMISGDKKLSSSAIPKYKLDPNIEILDFHVHGEDIIAITSNKQVLQIIIR